MPDDTEQAVELRDAINKALTPDLAHIDVPQSPEDMNLELIIAILDLAGVSYIGIEEEKLRVFGFNAWLAASTQYDADHPDETLETILAAKEHLM